MGNVYVGPDRSSVVDSDVPGGECGGIIGDGEAGGERVRGLHKLLLNNQGLLTTQSPSH